MGKGSQQGEGELEGSGEDSKVGYSALPEQVLVHLSYKVYIHESKGSAILRVFPIFAFCVCDVHRPANIDGTP